MIGQRLLSARRAAGLSLRELAEKIDNKVSAQAITKYEHNEMMPNSTVLMAMADALGVSEDFLLSPGEVSLEDAEFRKEITGEKEEAALEAKILSEVERYLEIEEILAASSSHWTPPRDFPARVASKEEAESAAKRLREVWKLGLDPIPNLVEFVEERGIKVVCIPLPQKISGVMCWVRHKDGSRLPVIGINQAHDGERQRFSLAHELGHLVLEIPKDFPAKDKEALCHRFGGAFLMPRELMVVKLGPHRRLVPPEELFALKAVFGASAQAIAYRCKDLDIINQAGVTQIFKIFNARGWRQQEPMRLEPERPTRFGRLCLRALAEKSISESKAAELLGVPVRRLDEQLYRITGLDLE